MATAMAAIIGSGRKKKIDSVTIRKAENGFTVTCWDGRKDISMIAADLDEALDCVEQLFGYKEADDDMEEKE